MIKLGSLLACLLVVCALALVTSQHKARKLFSELTQEQEVTRQLDVEWGQLQLEQSTWAMHARIEKIATGRLQMRMPATDRVNLVFDEVGGSLTADQRKHVRTLAQTKPGEAHLSELQAEAER